MTRSVPYSSHSSYTVIPLTSSFPQSVSLEHIEAQHVYNNLPILKILASILIVSMIISTIIGNLLVCLAVMLVRKLQQPANFLIVSLAVADCLVGMLVMPLALVDLMFEKWPLGRSMCKLYTTADLTLCTASIVNLCAISVDRYLVISRPLRYTVIRTTSRILTYIAIVWLVAALVSLSSHIISNLLDTHAFDEADTCEVIQHFAYQIYATIIAFYGPTMIMVILYVKIWRAAKRLSRLDRSLAPCNTNEVDKNGNERTDLLEKETSYTKVRSNSGRLFKSDRKYMHRPSAFLHAVKAPLIRHHEGHDCKARKTLGVIMSVFIICWFPFFFLAILKSCLGVIVPYWLDILTLWLGYSNSMLNPAIYCKYTKEFRTPFREILCCRCRTLQNVVRQQSFTSRYGPSIKRRQPSSSVHLPLLPRRNDSHPECSDV